jgi:hypothetical protein
MNELNIGLVGRGRVPTHLSNVIGAAAIIETMNEMAQTERLSRLKPAPSKRKSAFPEKKAKRKMMQASRKKNR